MSNGNRAKEIFWLTDYADEVVPCDCTLGGWAEWLSKPDEEWNRADPAADGATFRATRAEVTYHSMRGGQLEPPLPHRYNFVAVAMNAGGWPADEIAESFEDLADAISFYGDDAVSIAAVVADTGRYTVTYRSDPPRCAVARDA
jgi:hypothetical protein